jgi:uncharacterized protein
MIARRVCVATFFLAALLVLSLRFGNASAEEPKAGKKLNVVVIAGGHPYAQAPFRAIYKNYADMNVTFVEEKDGGEAFDDIQTWPYDVILLYNFEKNPSPKRRENLLKLLDRGVGLVILHHAIYGYRPWPEFQKIVGVTSWLSGAKDNVPLTIQVADPKHPIVQGLADFAIIDEAYLDHKLAEGPHVILTAAEATNAKHVAWVHKYKNAPVVYFQLGHDEKAYRNASFVKILGQSIRWAGGRLPAAK